MDPEPDAVLTRDELSEYLKIAKSTLYKLAQEGSIPAQKVGKHWRFRKAAIDQWLRSRATGRAAPPGTARNDERRIADTRVRDGRWGPGRVPIYELASDARRSQPSQHGGLASTWTTAVPGAKLSRAS